MIGKISGIVDSVYNDHLIVDVNGVGYIIFCSTKTLALYSPYDKIAIFVETYVRENDISLFGFLTKEEKYSFNMLKTVSGVGAKVAMTILSHFTPDELGNIIANADKAAFRSVSGVGPKLAERIFVELKDKVFCSNICININNDIIADAISALVSLGMNKSEANNIVRGIIQEQSDISIDNLIRIALQKRAKI